MTGPNGQHHRETEQAAEKRELAAAIAWLVGQVGCQLLAMYGSH